MTSRDEPGRRDADYALRLEHVSKTFGGVRALKDVSFTVAAGEVHCLAGENGCGKSTLIKIVTGVHQPDPGAHLEIFGETYTAMSPTLARSLGIAVIWQDLALFPHMTVAENIAFDTLVGAVPTFVGLGRSRVAVRRVLQRLGVQLNLDAQLHTLPIAQRQVVAIARALMGDARLVFMDEPTASLTRSETDALLGIVRTLSSQGVAVVFVSHRLAEVIDIAARVTVIRDGNLVGAFPATGMTQARLGELMTGATHEHAISACDRTGEPPVLELTNLTRHGAFEDVSLTIRRGEVVGLIGLIGAGRTELAHAIIGMEPADSGEILIDGTRLRPRSIRDAIKQGIAYVSEDRLSLGLIQPQSIGDNTSISVLDQLLNWTGLISPSKQDELVRHWIDELAVKIGHPDDAVSTLSGGNQQRVVLAKWLATKPRFLILDSPTVGVDVGARAGIFRIVRRLANEGLAILLICDEVTEVMLNADRVVHMADGRLIDEHDPHHVSVEAMEKRIYA